MSRRETLLKLKGSMPQFVGHALERLSDTANIQEIRLRTGRPPGIVSFGREGFLTENGSITDYPDMCRAVTASEIEQSFRAVCDYSVHSFSREIAEGFITMEGGNRVGFCGTAVTENGRVTTLKYISGLNFRIAGQVVGCAEPLYQKAFSEGLKSLLLIGAPMSGKTTIIRDLCRILGRKYRTSVIDERGEIGAAWQGATQNDIGCFTDVFDGYPKADGIMTAVRVMSPEVIVCDEIGGEQDCSALLSTANMGVKIIASVHGSSIEDIRKRKYLSEVLDNGLFDCFAVLGNGKNPGRIKMIERL